MTPINDGHDVSHWQGVFPWAWCAAQGHRLAACKATEGVGGVDSQLRRNRAEMARCGFRWRGLYHWVTEAPIAAQVEHFVRTVGALEPGECIQLDCEQSPATGAPRKLTSDEMAAAWVAFERVYPGRCVMYAGRFYNAWHAHPTLVGVPWWLPWYGPDSWEALLAEATRKGGLPWTPTVWQWGGGAEGAVVPGVVAHDGRCDSNQIIRADVLDRICGLTVGPIPSPEEDDMTTLIRVDGDAAVLAVDGLFAAWAVSGPVIAEHQGLGNWATKPVQVVSRAALRPLTLLGPEPDYSTGDGGLPGRTTAADFAAHLPSPTALSGTVSVSGDVRLVG